MFEIQKNTYLTVTLLIFAFIVITYRVWDVYLRKYGVCSGKIYHGWTLQGLTLCHSLVGLLSIVEYLLAPKSYHYLLGFSAFVVFMLAHAFRNWAIHALGQYHSPQIEIKPNHRLIGTGPYRYFRHPYYLGASLEVVSTPLIFDAFYTFIFASCTYLPLVIVRLVLEEKVMRHNNLNWGVSERV